MLGKLKHSLSTLVLLFPDNGPCLSLSEQKLHQSSNRRNHRGQRHLPDAGCYFCVFADMG